VPEHVLIQSLSNRFYELRMNAHSFNFFGGALGNACRCQTGSYYDLHVPHPLSINILVLVLRIEGRYLSGEWGLN
jgi:hypothetical protein